MTRRIALKIGTRIRDRNGFEGTVSNVNECRGTRWYDICFDRGYAVRYDSELVVVLTEEEERILFTALDELAEATEQAEQARAALHAATGGTR